MTTLVTGRAMRVSPGPVLVLLIVLCLVLAGCSRADEPASGGRSPSSGSVSPSASPSPPRVATTTRYGQVIGRLPGRERQALRRKITAVVDGWWEASFLGGEYPRTEFPAAFPRFTQGVQARARRDKDLLSNRVPGPHIDSVTAMKRIVVLDVIAADGRARGVTARFLLRFRTTGERAGVTTLKGRLLLSPRTGRWKIFGYEVNRQVRA